jgi:hypothetical protein
MVQPKKYRAKDLNGNTVTGWFAELHIPNFDNHGNQIEGYEVVPSLFNDEQGERSKGGYWHTIVPDTLEEINEPIQLELF